MKYNRFTVFSTTILLSFLTSIGTYQPLTYAADDYQTCANAESDPDDDGWGWENGTSCLVANNTGESSATPTCRNASSDPDGDGWGWENGSSCVVANDSDSSSAHPACVNASSDPDGDGWGWENNQSCIVAENPGGETGGEVGTEPSACVSANSDSDGDGWGWENGQSCRVTGPTTPPVAAGDLPYYASWPAIESTIAKDPAMETEIARILSLMTLEEKVGQMIQPNLNQVTPAEAAQYKLGSLLNGGGTWPANNKYATAADWANTANEYWQAVDSAWQARGFKIPFMWATDAVHGHNNVFGATVFPHNIGLGAANDSELIFRIGQATAREVTATGLDWTFAPTVAAPRDDRWGRTYEGYSEDPEIIYHYASRMVEGLQGGAAGLKSDTHVISNVKHWVGDGGTTNGVDRGQNHYGEDYLRNLHAAGYFSGLSAGAQIVMSSFNSWHNSANYDHNGGDDYNKKVHGSQYLITDVLKGEMGFDGAVITDWNGQGEIDGCSAADCPAAVNAGNDIFMVTARVDWQAFHSNVIAQVDDGTIPMSRIDDAVTRILRVKMRADLWNKPAPAARSLAGDQTVLGSAAHRALAREAVTKSLVLLKNKNDVLPLDAAQSVYLTGSAANDIQKQTGGWSLTWQGTQNTIDDFPNASTLQTALQNVLGVERVITDLAATSADTVAVVAIGEDPYAEFQGDIKDHQTLGYAQLKPGYAADLETIRQLKARGMQVVTVFFSGRPMYVNEEINLSDAFIAAWLPGTEAGGITDLLYAVNGTDFSGRLSFSWPNTQCSTTINRVAPQIANYVTPAMEQNLDGEHAPLFAYGYGLSYANASQAPDLDNLPLDEREFGCGQSAPDTGVATLPLEIYGRNSTADFSLRISGAANGWAAIEVPSEQSVDQGNVATAPINYQGQYDAVHVTFDGEGLAQIYTQYPNELGRDLYSYRNAASTLQFDIRMQQLPTKDFTLAQHCVWPCLGDVVLNDFLPAVSEEWSTVKIPLECFAQDGMDYASVNTPFLFLTDSATEFDLGNIRLVPASLDPGTNALTCEQLSGNAAIELLNEPVSNILSNDLWAADPTLYTAHTGSDWSPVEDYVTLTTEGSDADTVISVEYSNDHLDSDKGLVLLSGNAQDISNYVENGALKFDLFIENYAANTNGLVIKMEGATTGPDYFLGAANTLPTGQWHSISVAIADLGLNDKQITQIKTPFAILPAWEQPQGGVVFRFRNVRLDKRL